jgi:predicted house-cleaning noncanonical NTP pyrophosphatase (MazG superfamily)
MPEKVHNILVRDRIPEIISESGGHAETRVLSQPEYLRALKAKLVEEAEAASNTGSTLELALEIGDVLEVVDALIHAHGFLRSEIDAYRHERAASRGTFKQRLMLLRTSTPDQEPSAG